MCYLGVFRRDEGFGTGELWLGIFLGGEFGVDIAFVGLESTVAHFSEFIRGRLRSFFSICNGCGNRRWIVVYIGF